MSWYKKSTYHNQNYYLRKYLEHGFDPWDFAYLLEDFMQEEYPEEYEQYESEYEDEFERQEVILENMNDSMKSEFENFVDKSQNRMYEADLPVYMGMSLNRSVRKGWFVHFTNDADAIEQNGFLYGHEDYTGLHLTTYKTEKSRKRDPGYNFAFNLGDRNVDYGGDKKYGEEAVVFFGDGIEATHYGDQEDQVIFWGPSISKENIFAVKRNEGGYWQAGNFESDKLNEVGEWIVANQTMLKNIKRKEEKRVKQYGLSRKKENEVRELKDKIALELANADGHQAKDISDLGWESVNKYRDEAFKQMLKGNYQDQYMKIISDYRKALQYI